ncbi:hypothetical protein BJY52DRAFT_100985 [Lactarius psammicola]|nr:hypothetical protein BJY52DRAFT_100985 [Lactarius psammicola]
MQRSVSQTPQVHDRDDPSSSAGDSVYATHTYVMETDYAFVSIRSHARNICDIPLMYLEEKTIGTVVFPECHLHEVRGIIVVLQVLASDAVEQASETKLKLSSEEVRRSHTSNGEFRWHFALSPPTTAGPSLLTASEQANSTLRYSPIQSHDRNQNFQLRVTIRRRFSMRKIRMKRSIRYIPRPGDLSTPLPPPQTIAITPRNLPSSWTGNKCPEVVVRGVIFGLREVEVECRLIIPASYPVNDSIPLRLIMTCEDREALDLFAVPHVIDVRLLKVLAFGNNAAAAAPPFTLRNRESYHITNWVATALWNVNGHTIQENGRLRIKLNGRLLRDLGAEITHSFAEPGMALLYYVCLFPFRSDDFRPLCPPDRIIFYGRIPLTE